MHVNHRLDDKLHASRTTDTETVAAVFISRHAHDMIEMRNRRFLAASVDVVFLPLTAVEPLAFLEMTPILYHDIYNKKRGANY